MHAINKLGIVALGLILSGCWTIYPPIAYSGAGGFKYKGNEWTSSDSVLAMSYDHAQKACENFWNGARLPSPEELLDGASNGPSNFVEPAGDYWTATKDRIVRINLAQKEITKGASTDATKYFVRCVAVAGADRADAGVTAGRGACTGKALDPEGRASGCRDDLTPESCQQSFSGTFHAGKKCASVR